MPVLGVERACTTGPATTSSTIRGVEVRLVDLGLDGDAVACAESWLTPAEVARARRGTPAVHRRRVLLRAALRSALAEELGTDPASVPLEATAAGRPFVAGTAVDVSCSASGVLGVVAVARDQRVGVDVQRVVPWSVSVLDEGWLAPDERRALTALPLAARPEATTRAWTQKEAVLKARGTGLLDDPSTILTYVGRSAGVVAGWTVDNLPVPAGWMASLAVGPVKETSA